MYQLFYEQALCKMSTQNGEMSLVDNKSFGKAVLVLLYPRRTGRLSLQFKEQNQKSIKMDSMVTMDTYLLSSFI